jgi:hypothetical protein
MKGGGCPMNRIASVMAMQVRDRGTWFVIPASTLGAVFVIGWFIVLSRDVFMGDTNDAFTPAVAAVYIMILVGSISAVTGTYPFAVGFGTRRRDYFLGTLAMAVAVSASWAIVLGALSLIEARLIPNWGVGLHFFHLPFFSDGSLLRQFCWTPGAVCAQADPNYVSGGLPLGQFWVYFVLLLFMCLLGLLLGSIYQRFGRTGIYVALGVVFVLLSLFLLVSGYCGWWGAIIGWLAQQTAAGLAWWLLPPMALYALVSYALLRKATV